MPVPWACTLAERKRARKRSEAPDTLRDPAYRVPRSHLRATGPLDLIHGRVDGLRSVDIVLTDIILELIPDRFHHFDPLSALFGCEFAHNTSSINNGLHIGGVHSGRFGTPRNRHLVDDRLELVAHIRVEALPPVDIGHQQIVDDAVVGFGETVLYFEELLAVDVGLGVLLPVDNAGLQRAIDFREGHRLGRAADRGHLRFQHVRRLHAEFQPARIRRGDKRDICFNPLCQKARPSSPRRTMESFIACPVSEL